MLTEAARRLPTRRGSSDMERAKDMARRLAHLDETPPR